MNGGLEIIIYNRIVRDIELGMKGKKVGKFIIYEIQSIADYCGSIYSETYCLKKEFLNIESGQIKKYLGIPNCEFYNSKNIVDDKSILIKCAKRLVNECHKWGKIDIHIKDIQQSIYNSILDYIVNIGIH